MYYCYKQHSRCSPVNHYLHLYPCIHLREEYYMFSQSLSETSQEFVSLIATGLQRLSPHRSDSGHIFCPELHSSGRHLLLLLSGQTVFSTISNVLDLTVFLVSLFLTAYTPLNLGSDFWSCISCILLPKQDRVFCLRRYELLGTVVELKKNNFCSALVCTMK